MTTKQFISVAQKLLNIKEIHRAKKGEHNPMLGTAQIGYNDRQNEILWRKYRTLSNMIIIHPENEINAKLKENGITEFIAVKTKSGRFCRLQSTI